MSAQPSVCNHRLFEVVIVVEGAVIAGLLGGLFMAVLGVPPRSAMAAGAGTLVGVFTVAMTAMSYVKKPDS
ncbi:hypothetical protein LHJ74_19170 [Streptomyces sp. N2-109]|uniref:Uncharacterized protein n=1 Tax=Streptomyces gossypii TaxID=2883101 RepID=A0ABT2JVT4_9ACTN|nr:hypothetical protein [Streptomyces gossypii]MCT2591996.1 hypothetical protein [Streptomyces gossypii]